MPTRRAVLSVAVLAAALAAPSTAEAANACRAHAEHSKVLAQSNTALVYAKGPRFKHYVSACTFKGQKSYRLPGQDGGDTHKFLMPRLNGRYLAYSIFNQEEASPTATSTVYSVDLGTRRKLIEDFAGGSAAVSDESTTDVRALVVGKKGSVAWINESINLDVKFSVRAKAPGKKQVLLDEGNDIGVRSLALADNNAAFYWTRAGQANASTLP